MLYIKNNLILGTIKKIIGIVFKAIYKVLSLFNLQPFLFTGVLGLILLITGVFGSSEVLKYVFYILLGLTLLYALIKSLSKLVPHKKVNNVQIVNQNVESIDKTQNNYQSSYNENYQAGYNQTPSSNVQSSFNNQERQNYPKYYTVRQNPNYIYAEYADRYELYYKTPNGLKHVRSDRK